MQLITIDFETYYDLAFSLSKLTTEEYIRDPRFEVIGVSVKVGTDDAQCLIVTEPVAVNVDASNSAAANSEVSAVLPVIASGTSKSSAETFINAPLAEASDTRNTSAAASVNWWSASTPTSAALRPREGAQRTHPSGVSACRHARSRQKAEAEGRGQKLAVLT